MSFSTRHIGPNADDINKMLSFLGFDSVEELINATIPKDIKYNESLNIGESISEFDFLKAIKNIGEKNEVVKKMRLWVENNHSLTAFVDKVFAIFKRLQ